MRILENLKHGEKCKEWVARSSIQFCLGLAVIHNLMDMNWRMVRLRDRPQLYVLLTYLYSGYIFAFLKMMEEESSQILFPLLI